MNENTERDEELTRDFDESGHDMWGYSITGHYNKAFDRAPFQMSPFPHCQRCDDGMCEQVAA